MPTLENVSKGLISLPICLTDCGPSEGCSPDDECHPDDSDKKIIGKGKDKTSI